MINKIIRLLEDCIWADEMRECTLWTKAFVGKPPHKHQSRWSSVTVLQKQCYLADTAHSKCIWEIIILQENPTFNLKPPEEHYSGHDVCDVPFDAEGNASGTVGYWASANQFLMQYHLHQIALPSSTSEQWHQKLKSLEHTSVLLQHRWTMRGGRGITQRHKNKHYYSFHPRAVQ